MSLSRGLPVQVQGTDPRLLTLAVLKEVSHGNDEDNNNGIMVPFVAVYTASAFRKIISKKLSFWQNTRPYLKSSPGETEGRDMFVHGTHTCHPAGSAPSPSFHLACGQAGSMGMEGELLERGGSPAGWAASR